MARKRNIRIVVEYDGTGLFGWQLQKDKPTVQGELQRALQEIEGRKVLVIGSGRTDAGVHAEGQVANFHTDSQLPSRKWPDALNAHLPPEIAVIGAMEVPLAFHAQYGATSKTYRYRVLNRVVRGALDRLRSHLVKAPLDVARMREAAKVLVGTHDFRSFGSEMSKKEKTVRTICSFEVLSSAPFIDFVVTGDGFLYNQVRSMVGTLLRVGLGAEPVDWVRTVLEAKDRTKAGANVPAKGLTLVEVKYDGKPRCRPGAADPTAKEEE
ncbi:MAG TPA: tRNA pseudouridine(38-40) synthase TruA [Planctomycetota bacterium]|nr:tRNA pseudouridine(38-40) synthase TruA [Planctomycetota bacterium]